LGAAVAFMPGTPGLFGSVRAMAGVGEAVGARARGSPFPP
jgi:hypothetical protein